MGQIQSFDELVGLLIRRRVLIAAFAAFGLLISVVYAKLKPDVFETAAVIQVEIPVVDEGNGSQIGGGAAQLLQTIEQRLTTRENLLAVIDRHGLFADQSGMSDDQKVDSLNNAVTFKSVASANGTQSAGAATISAIFVLAALNDPHLAARVANDFAQEILDQSSAGQMDSARETVDFFAEEEARLSSEIAGLEAEIADYKNAHVGADAAANEAMHTELTAVDTELRELARELLALESARAAINQVGIVRETDRRKTEEIVARLPILSAQQQTLTTRRATIEVTLAAAPEVERVLSGFDRRLAHLQALYDGITDRMADARTALRLAERRQAERFTLLERAVTPEFPSGTAGKKLVMLGALISLVAGLGMAFAMDLMNPVIRTAGQMEREFGLRPMVSIPEIARPGRNHVQVIYRLLDNPEKPVFGMPRFAVVAAVATLALVIVATAIGQ